MPTAPSPTTTHLMFCMILIKLASYGPRQNIHNTKRAGGGLEDVCDGAVATHEVVKRKGEAGTYAHLRSDVC